MNRSIAFMPENRDRLFFLFLSLADIHPPRLPHPRVVSVSESTSACAATPSSRDGLGRRRYGIDVGFGLRLLLAPDIESTRFLHQTGSQ